MGTGQLIENPLQKYTHWKAVVPDSVSSLDKKRDTSQPPEEKRITPCHQYDSIYRTELRVICPK